MSKNEPIEKIVYKDYTINIYHDEDPLNPRRDWDNFGTMLCFHKRYNLGDKDVPSIRTSDFEGWDEMREHLEKEYGAAVILPLYLYDHSGISMSVGGFSDPWDSGQVGFIYLTNEKKNEIREGFRGSGMSEEEFNQRVEEILREEVKTYDRYLTGEVYGYVITGPDGKEVEDCWGFFGDTKDIIQECKDTVDHIIRRAEE